MTRFGMCGRAKRQCVQAGDRTRAHGEDIAQDTANPRRRPLIGLDVARVIVALHLEHAGKPVADVDDAGIFAGPLDDPRALGRQCTQMNFRGFVRAVLVPHGRENAELGERRFPANELQDPVVFVLLEAVLGDKLGSHADIIRDHGYAARSNASASPANNPRPSVGPIAASTWFSGCGIMPSTLPRSFRMPAIALMAPLWFQFGSIKPSGEQYRNSTRPSPSMRAMVSPSAM